MSKLKKPIRKKRKLRVGRLFILIIVFLIFCTAIGFVMKGVYVAGQNTYQFCQNISEDYQKRLNFQSKYQNEKFENYTNILFIGVDDGDINDAKMARRADALMLVSISHASGKIEVLSIPRDTLVTLPGRSSQEKVSQSYTYGGTQLVVRTVEEFLQVPINHYIVVDWNTFVSVIDTLGGIDLYVENDMYYEDPYAELTIDLKKGFQHLDGNAAGKYVRYRSDDLADIGRVKRQQRMIKAIYEQAAHVDAVVKIPEVVDIINKNVTTSLAAFDAAKVAKHINGVTAESIHMQMVPGDFQAIDGETYWQANRNEFDQMLNAMFRVEDEQKNKNQ